MYFNPLNIAKEAEGWEGKLDGPSFEVAPSELYPQTIAQIRKMLDAEGWVAPEYLRQHFMVAKEVVPEDAWDLALVARDDCPLDRLQDRVLALECARRWFMAALHASIGGTGMNLLITKDEAWRL